MFSDCPGKLNYYSYPYHVVINIYVLKALESVLFLQHLDLSDNSFGLDAAKALSSSLILQVQSFSCLYNMYYLNESFTK